MLRLFFALQPALEQSRSLVERTMPLVAWLRALSAPPENVHATLCFIGACPEARLDALLAVGESVRGAHATLRFDAYEYWWKPRILCATASDDAGDAAAALARELGERATDAGFAPDGKPFRPHLTLARKADPTLVAALDWPQPLEPGFVVRCEKFALMESRRDERGSIYSVVKSWPLYAEGGA
jgi:2'-5' RNA ligase